MFCSLLCGLLGSLNYLLGGLLRSDGEIRRCGARIASRPADGHSRGACVYVVLVGDGIILARGQRLSSESHSNGRLLCGAIVDGAAVGEGDLGVLYARGGTGDVQRELCPSAFRRCGYDGSTRSGGSYPAGAVNFYHAALPVKVPRRQTDSLPDRDAQSFAAAEGQGKCIRLGIVAVEVTQFKAIQPEIQLAVIYDRLDLC